MSRPKFENPFGNIWSVAQAQDADAVAAPTIPIDDGRVSPTPSTTIPDSNKLNMKLAQANPGNLSKGETTIIQLEINSKNSLVGRIQSTFTFDPEMLDVLQGTLIDPYFTKNEEILINKIQGIIVVSTDANGSPVPLNRPIVEFEVRIKDLGKTSLVFEEDSFSSFIKDAGNRNLPIEFSDLTLEAVDEENPTPTTSEAISITPSPTTTQVATFTPKPPTLTPTVSEGGPSPSLSTTGILSPTEVVSVIPTEFIEITLPETITPFPTLELTKLPKNNFIVSYNTIPLFSGVIFFIIGIILFKLSKSEEKEYL